jgi:hypothetical protein
MHDRGSAGARLGAAAIAVLVFLASAAPARADEPAVSASISSRFYAGLDLASLKVDDSYGGIDFSHSTVGAGLFGGYWVNDRLSVELEYEWIDALDLHDIAGSGITRFDITSQRNTVSVSVLRQVVLKDFLNLKRDWRVYGMLGVYESQIHRTATDLGSGAQVSSGDNFSGGLAAAGVLYTVGRFELRGYFRGWGDVREVGAGAQIRF